MRIGNLVLWDLYLATLLIADGYCVPFYSKDNHHQHNNIRSSLSPKHKRDTGVEYCDQYNVDDESIYTGGSLSSFTNQSLYFLRDCVLAVCWESGNPNPMYCPLSLVMVNSPDGSYVSICAPGTQDDSQGDWPSQCTDYANDAASLSCSRIWCATSTVSTAMTTTISALDFTSTFSGIVTRYHLETTTSDVQGVATTDATTNLPYPTETVVKRGNLLIRRQDAPVTSSVTFQGLQFSLPDTLSMIYVTDMTAVSVTVFDTGLTTEIPQTIQSYNTTLNTTFSVPAPTIPTDPYTPSPSNNPLTLIPIITPVPTSTQPPSTDPITSLQTDNIQALYAYVQTAIPETDATVPASQCFLHTDAVVKYTTPAWYSQMPTIAQSFISSINADNTLACMPGSETGKPIRAAAAVFGPGFNNKPESPQRELSTGQKIGIGFAILVALVIVSGIASLLVWCKQSGRLGHLSMSNVFGRRTKRINEKERTNRYGPLRGERTAYMGYGATAAGGGGDGVMEHMNVGIAAHNPLLPVEAAGDHTYENRQTSTRVPIAAERNMTFHELSNESTNATNRNYGQQPNTSSLGSTLQGFLGGVKYQQLHSGGSRDLRSSLYETNNGARDTSGVNNVVAAAPRTTSRRKPVASSINVTTRNITGPSPLPSSTEPAYISPTQAATRSPPAFQQSDQQRSSYSPYRPDGVTSPMLPTILHSSHPEHQQLGVPNDRRWSRRDPMSGGNSIVSAESEVVQREGLLSVTPPLPIGTPFSFEETGWTVEDGNVHRHDLYGR